MPSLAAVAASPMMRDYAQGAAQINVQPVADFLAPVVNVPTSIGRYKKYDDTVRFTIPDTSRALGGRATVLDFNATDGTYNCQPQALDFPVDFIEERESGFLESVLKDGADIIAQVAMLSHESKVITAAVTQMTTNGPTAVEWSEASDSSQDPVDQIDQAILNVIKAAAYGSLMGVGVLFGATAWRYFKNNPQVRAKFVGTQGADGGGQSTAIPKIGNVGNLFVSNPDVRQSFMVVNTAAPGLPRQIGFLLDTSVMIFARMANPSRHDPSFMKTFRLDGLWMVPGSYMRDDGRVQVAKYDWSEDLQITNTTAGQMLNVS